MKRLFKFKYPKLLILAIVIFLSYILFSSSPIYSYISNLGKLSYIGTIIAGFFFSFGFTTPFSIGYFLVSNPSNILLASLLGGFGALIADLTIYKLIKFSFMDEFERLEKTKPMKEIDYLMKKEFSTKFRAHLLYAFAGLIIASPLPDELGVTMLAGLSHIKGYIIGIISLIANTIGIYIILSI